MARPKKNTAAANDKPKTTECFESVLWKAADKMRKNIDAAEYKHVVLGLIFLRDICEAFGEIICG